MLITLSGVVGSGKSTLANGLLQALQQDGHAASTVRFQTLPCFRGLRRSVRPAPRHDVAGAASGHKRRTGYRRRSLTVAVALVHLMKIVAFRVYARRWRHDRPVILTRYFYDSLTHFELDGAVSRRCFRAIRRLMPVPDVAILVRADLATIAKRRPGYAHDYLAQASVTYDELRERCPELIAVSTDTPDDDPLARVYDIVKTRLELPSAS